MNQTIIKAPVVQLKKLRTLFIEMTAQNCNLRCKNCYIDFSDKKVKDFITFDKIKQTLTVTDKRDLEFICLTGAEPMLHPDFNKILRLCLQYSSVIIYTNAMNINDKKARFLRKVEEENSSEHEIIFMISLDSADEKENDEIRGRGSYRKSVHALQSLWKYEFNPIIATVNYRNRSEREIKNEFKEMCASFDMETSDINFKIIPYMRKNSEEEAVNILNTDNLETDCTNSRTLTNNGIFCCPILSSDNRGKCGNDFSDFDKKTYLETSFCSQCVKYGKSLFGPSL